jgi:hypothetical protein
LSSLRSTWTLATCEHRSRELSSWAVRFGDVDGGEVSLPRLPLGSVGWVVADLTRLRTYYPSVSWVSAYQRVTVGRLCVRPTSSTAMNLLHAPRATNLSNANHRIPSRYPDVRLSGSPANQSGTACVTPEDELPRRCTARLSLRRTISHIGNLICASIRGRADRSRHDGCRDEWCFHCLAPLRLDALSW